MNKKGFTLIEIIICIGLIAVIGTSCFFGIRYVTKKIKIDKLSQITEKALLAAEVYLETNKESYNKLYKEKNGVILPLKLLVNEGLLDLSATTLEDKDIKNEYIVTAFTGNGGKDDCINITANASWTMSNSSPLYICSNSGSGGNLTIILDDSTYDKVVNKERYIFKGNDPENYIKYGDKTYRIMTIERDDSLILASSDSFGNIFDGLTENIGYYLRSADNDKISNATTTTSNHNVGLLVAGGEYRESENEVLLSLVDIKDTAVITTQFSSPTYTVYFNSYINTLIGRTPSSSSHQGGAKYFWGNSANTNNFPGYKIHLKNCMKISGGIGNKANPYKLDNRCIN